MWKSKSSGSHTLAPLSQAASWPLEHNVQIFSVPVPALSVAGCLGWECGPVNRRGICSLQMKQAPSPP